ncbi:MAG: G5 domain-containing protein [Ruminococcus sp.]|nr:G5 domain-containing protein [Ruminococcus sp.]
MKKLKNTAKLRKILAIVLSLTIIFACTVLSANIYYRVRLTDGERELTLNTYTTNTNRILKSADITLSSADKVSKTEKGNTIYINVVRAYPVHIMYHNMEYVEFMAGGTVSEALKKAEINLSVDDVINHSGDTLLYDGIEIVIDEVKYISKSEIKSVKYDTKYVESDEHPQGYSKVVKKGVNGQTKITKTYKYVNGEFDSVCSKSKEVISKPKDAVVKKGTAQVVQASNITNDQENVVQTMSTNTSTAGSINGMSYSKVLTGSATAYTASQGALTSTGVPAYVGGVAVNPNIIPYGSKLYIVADGYTYGYATAVDTGGALMSGTALVDLYMSSYDECINFGRRNVKVYILN